MKTLALYTLLLLVLSTSTSVCSGAEFDAAFTKQISKVLAECQKITPGMTRARLLKVFTEEGGLSTVAQRTYVYRGCPYIKVDVEFKVADGERKERLTDIITKISRPYLQYAVID